MFIEYASVISFTYIGGLSIAYTIYAFVSQIYYAWLVVAIIWVMYLIMLARHHANIKRLFTHTENKIDFKAKLAKVFKHKKGETIIDEEFVEHAPEAEIIVTQLEKKEEKNEEVSEKLETEEIKEEDNGNIDFAQKDGTTRDDKNNEIEDDKEFSIQENTTLNDEKIDQEDLDSLSANSSIDEKENNKQTIDSQLEDVDIQEKVTDESNDDFEENANSDIEDTELKPEQLSKKDDDGDV